MSDENTQAGVEGEVKTGSLELVDYLTEDDLEAARSAVQVIANGSKPHLLVEAFGSPFWEIRSTAHELLANKRSKELVPYLGKALHSGEADRVYWSVKTLGYFGSRAAPALLQSIEKVPDEMRLFVVRALGECGVTSVDGAIPVLIELLDSDDWSLREEAAKLLVELREKGLPAVRNILKEGTQNQRFWAFKIMARIMGENAIVPLAKILETPAEELAEDSRPYALAALKEIRSAKVIPPLLALLSNDSWYLRAEAAEVLATVGDLAVKDLMTGLNNENSDVRFWILKVLRKILNEDAIEIIAEHLKSEHKGTRYSAVLTLGEIPCEKAAEILIDCFIDEAWVIRKAAADALALMGERAVEPLLRSLTSTSTECLYWALQTLGRVGGERAVAFIAKLLEHKDRSIRMAAIDALAGVGGLQAMGSLVNAFRNKEWVVRQRASDAMKSLGVPALIYLFAYVEDEHHDVVYWTRQTLQGFLLPGLDSILEQIKEMPTKELPVVQEELGRMDPETLLKDLKRADARLEDLLGNWKGRRAVTAASVTNEAQASTQFDMVHHDLLTLFDRKLGDTYGTTMHELLMEAEEAGASDLHLKVGVPPIFRVDGELRKTKHPPLSPGNTIYLCGSLLTALQKEELTQNLQIDLSYAVPSGPRFRVNMFLQTKGLEAAFRYIDPRIPSFRELNMPERQLRRIAASQDGLILVTGPTGCGKTTTLAAIINYINRSFAKHIITIEDPIEYVHENKLSYLSYREVGIDVRSFPMGLRGALREDPDVILIGELRDRETVSTALTLAGTGHLVLASFHTANASQTIEQLSDFYPAEQQEHVRRQLAFILKAVISQRLFSRRDKKGRIPAYEILVSSHAVRNLIREGSTQQLFSVMQSSAELGMTTFDSILQDLVESRIVAYDEALPFVYDPTNFRQPSATRTQKKKL